MLTGLSPSRVVRLTAYRDTWSIQEAKTFKMAVISSFTKNWFPSHIIIPILLCCLSSSDQEVKNEAVFKLNGSLHLYNIKIYIKSILTTLLHMCLPKKLSAETDLKSDLNLTSDQANTLLYTYRQRIPIVYKICIFEYIIKELSESLYTVQTLLFQLISSDDMLTTKGSMSHTDVDPQQLLRLHSLVMRATSILLGQISLATCNIDDIPSAFVTCINAVISSLSRYTSRNVKLSTDDLDRSLTLRESCYMLIHHIYTYTTASVTSAPATAAAATTTAATSTVYANMPKVSPLIHESYTVSVIKTLFQMLELEGLDSCVPLHTALNTLREYAALVTTNNNARPHVSDATTTTTTFTSPTTRALQQTLLVVYDNNKPLGDLDDSHHGHQPQSLPISNATTITTTITTTQSSFLDQIASILTATEKTASSKKTLLILLQWTQALYPWSQSSLIMILKMLSNYDTIAVNKHLPSTTTSTSQSYASPAQVHVSMREEEDGLVVDFITSEFITLAKQIQQTDNSNNNSGMDQESIYITRLLMFINLISSKTFLQYAIYTPTPTTGASTAIVRYQTCHYFFRIINILLTKVHTGKGHNSDLSSTFLLPAATTSLDTILPLLALLNESIRVTEGALYASIGQRILLTDLITYLNILLRPTTTTTTTIASSIKTLLELYREKLTSELLATVRTYTYFIKFSTFGKEKLGLGQLSELIASICVGGDVSYITLLMRSLTQSICADCGSISLSMCILRPSAAVYVLIAVIDAFSHIFTTGAGLLDTDKYSAVKEVISKTYLDLGQSILLTLRSYHHPTPSSTITTAPSTTATIGEDRSMLVHITQQDSTTIELILSGFPRLLSFAIYTNNSGSDNVSNSNETDVSNVYREILDEIKHLAISIFHCKDAVVSYSSTLRVEAIYTLSLIASTSPSTASTASARSHTDSTITTATTSPTAGSAATDSTSAEQSLSMFVWEQCMSEDFWQVENTSKTRLRGGVLIPPLSTIDTFRLAEAATNILTSSSHTPPTHTPPLFKEGSDKMVNLTSTLEDKITIVSQSDPSIIQHQTSKTIGVIFLLVYTQKLAQLTNPVYVTNISYITYIKTKFIKYIELYLCFLLSKDLLIQDLASMGLCMIYNTVYKIIHNILPTVVNSEDEVYINEAKIEWTGILQRTIQEIIIILAKEKRLTIDSGAAIPAVPDLTTTHLNTTGVLGTDDVTQHDPLIRAASMLSQELGIQLVQQSENIPITATAVNAQSTGRSYQFGVYTTLARVCKKVS